MAFAFPRRKHRVWYGVGLFFVGLLGWLLWNAPRAWAAGTPWEIRIVQVTPVAFPQMEARVWVWDPDARRVPSDLPREAFTVLEDGQPATLQQVDQENPGLQVVFVLNPSRSFAIRDVQGVTRYTYVYHQIRSWLETVTPGRHRFGLIIAGGPRVDLTEDPQAILQALEAYTPPREERSLTLAPLQQGLRMVDQPSPRPGMPRLLLFITSPLEQVLLNGVPALAEQIRAKGVHAAVWVVGSPQEWRDQRDVWETFARTTQGHAMFFSGTEVLPDLKEVAARRDRLYVLRYLSPRRQGGEVSIQVQVDWQERRAASLAYRYHLDLRPPVPILEDLPEAIVRVYESPEQRGTPEALKPTQWRLSVKVEFPDGIVRDVKRVTLYVDGQPVAERTSPPFDRLFWDLTALAQPGTRRVRVEVEDAFGLVGSTPEFPVRILIGEPTPRPASSSTALPAEARGFPWIYLLFGIAGLLLVAVVAWGTWMEYRGRRLSTMLARRRRILQAEEKPALSAVRLVLLPLEEKGEALVVQGLDVCVGRDAERCTWVLEHPSVSPVHARFWYDDAADAYRVADLGSEAGTWVNYAPVSRSGLLLEEGDLVHIGRPGFRVKYERREG